MSKKFITTIIILVCMILFGIGVNRWLVGTQSKLIAHIVAPQQAEVSVNLPGTIYLSQQGTLYALNNAHFAKVNLPASGYWIQPAQDGSNLLIVNRQEYFSDAYLVTPAGKLLSQITNNAGPVPVDPNNISDNQWIFWPHILADGQTLVASMDYPKNGYEVDFSIWQNPISNWNIPNAPESDQWTTPNEYTGGDTTPEPLADGGLFFTHAALVDIGNNENILNVIGYQPNAPAQSTYLTTNTQDCSQPNVSPNQLELAMICTFSSSNTDQLENIVTAPILDGGASLGPLHTAVANCLCAYPTWSPDNKNLIYLAPVGLTGPFQLWWDQKPLTASKPVQVTTVSNSNSLDFDATSQPLWVATP